MHSVELFAGCGGLALGVAEAGFDHDVVVENDPRACATIEFNKTRGVRHFSKWAVTQSDIQEIDFSCFKNKIDLLSGGPPCQPFSIGGKHKGPSDKRNMWPEALRAVSEIRPKAFIFENVRGLLRPAFANYLEFLVLQLSHPEKYIVGRPWRKQLKKLKTLSHPDVKPSYHVVVRAINAADYGASQKRHRAIFMGVRSDIADEVIFPAPTHSQEALIWNQRISGEYWEKHKIPRRDRPDITLTDKKILDRLQSLKNKPMGKPWKTVRDTIGDLPKPSPTSEVIINHRLHPGARFYTGHTGSTWDEPAKALKAGAHGVPGGENILVDKGRVRYFTTREMARLQGFPDGFAINTTWQSSIKQLGNAVPVQVGYTFGKVIKKYLTA